VLTWREMIRMNNRLPVPGGTITGLPTTPLPGVAEVIEKLGLWQRVPAASSQADRIPPSRFPEPLTYP